MGIETQTTTIRIPILNNQDSMEVRVFFSVAHINHINIYTSRLMETNQLKSEVHSIEERRDLDMLDMLDLDAC